MVTMKDKELLKLLLKNGWQLSEIKGSHHILTKKRKNRSNPCTRQRYENRFTY